jgi:hypothetical protein
MSSMKDKLSDAGHKVAEGVSDAADWVKEKTGMGSSCGDRAAEGTAAIQPHMEVIASCGTKVGTVDHVEGNAIKLTKDSCGDGMHHFLPMSMVDHVDRHVHLNKNSKEALAGWQSGAATCSGSGSCG